MALTKVQNTGIADDAVTTDKIENSTVLAADLAASSVTNAKISTGTIGNDKLTNSSVTINGSSLSLGGSATLKHIDWQALTVADGSTTLTATAGKGYFLDTNTGVIEVFLPSSPTRGDTIVLVDYSGTFSTNMCIINTGGQNIDSTVGTDFKVTTNNSIVELVYVDANKGWLVKLNQAAGSTPSGVMNDAGGYDTKGFMEATGGTITTSGDFKIHTFTGDGCFVVTTAGGNTAGHPTTVDYLVVAGGGAGGNGVGNTGAGSGAGAGGYRESKASTGPNHTASPHTASPLAASTGLNIGTSTATFPVTVGAGGAGAGGAPNKDKRGPNGSNSVFSTITAAGGGAGGSGYDASPLSDCGPQPGPDRREGVPGGSAGGSRSGPVPGYSGPLNPTCGVAQGNTPPVSPPQGNNGNMTAPPAGGGGGGGASQAGQAASNDGNEKGGVGGNGATSSINGTPTARAGGGGGSGYHSGAVTQAPGGTGGGGSGSYCVSASGAGYSGTANTGGGGGGGKGHPGPSENVQTGGSGGKGIVIIRYRFQ